ncbi:hypothetical protein D5086_017434 [Populus alba]|uniref:Uncharacterized protein n=1 Tax=Populus alba TaxID=43335 RepID=A0ACC4BY65_POPAL
MKQEICIKGASQRLTPSVFPLSCAGNLKPKACEAQVQSNPLKMAGANGAHREARDIGAMSRNTRASCMAVTVATFTAMATLAKECLVLPVI